MTKKNDFFQEQSNQALDQRILKSATFELKKIKDKSARNYWMWFSLASSGIAMLFVLFFTNSILRNQKTFEPIEEIAALQFEGDQDLLIDFVIDFNIEMDSQDLGLEDIELLMELSEEEWNRES